MMYRSFLNGHVPRQFIAREFLPYLPVSVVAPDGVIYTDNLSVEKLLRNTQLLKQIQLQQEEKQYQLQLKLQGVQVNADYNDPKGKI